MIINEKEAAARLGSPMNLINRLAATKGSKKNNAMSLFIKPKEDKEEKEVKISFNPFANKKSEPPVEEPKALIKQETTTLETILENHEAQIKLGLAHDQSLELLTRSVSVLSAKLDDVKADKLPSVITAASKVVDQIRRERNEASKNNKDREVHYHFYTPNQRKIEEFEVIDVGA